MILTEGIKDQNRRTSVSLNGVGIKSIGAFQKSNRHCRDQGDPRTRFGKVQVGRKTIEQPTRQKPIALGEDFSSKQKENSIHSIILDYAPLMKPDASAQPKKRSVIEVSAKVFIDCL